MLNSFSTGLGRKAAKELAGQIGRHIGPQHGEVIGEYRGDPLYHASLSAAEYEALAAASGFEVVLHVANDAAAGGRTAWLCRRREPE